MGDTISVDRKLYEALQREHEQSKKDVEDLRVVVMGVMGVLGFVEDGKVKKELFEPDPDIIGPAVKSIGGLMTDMLQTKMPGPFGKSATARLEEKFHFIKLIPPILKRHGANIG